MSKPDDVTQEAWDIAFEIADAWEDPAYCDVEQMTEEIARCLEGARRRGEIRERAECLKIIENTAQGSLQANLALSLAYETIKKRGEVK